MSISGSPERGVGVDASVGMGMDAGAGESNQNAARMLHEGRHLVETFYALLLYNVDLSF